MNNSIILISMSEYININIINLFFLKLFQKKNYKVSFINLEYKNQNRQFNNDFLTVIKQFNNVKIVKYKFFKNFSKYKNKKNLSFYLNQFKKISKNLSDHSDLILIKGFPYIEKYSSLINYLHRKISNILQSKIYFLISSKNSLILKQELNFQLFLINTFFLKNKKKYNFRILFLKNFYKSKFLSKNFKHKNENNYFFKKKEIVLLCKKNIILKKKFKNFLDIVDFKNFIFWFSLRNLLKIFSVKLFLKNNYKKKIDLININEIYIFDNFFKIKKIKIKKNIFIILFFNNNEYFNKALSFISKNKCFFVLLLVGLSKKKFFLSALYKYCKRKKILFFFTKKNIFKILKKISIIKKNYIFLKNYFLYDFEKIFLNDIQLKIFSLLKKNQSNQNFFKRLGIKFNLFKTFCGKQKNIILPEGEEPRIIKAACLAHKLNIANCILIGNKKNIENIAFSLNLIIPKKLIIISYYEAKKSVLKLYNSIFYNLKVSEKKIFSNCNIFVGALMVKNNIVDGLVAGSIHTTSHIILAALRCVGKRRDIKLISSLFIMLFKKKFLIYSDCAVNPNPSYKELCEIAIQSANFSKIFGLNPKIAMLSYSTELSAKGPMINKVYKATQRVKKKCPDIIIEGPIQYDSASNITISNLKNKNSCLKGKANIFIFPDLNSGNITYKSVQIHSNAYAIGPILLGLKKPVNDLSRGSNVLDILYTIFITSLQV